MIYGKWLRPVVSRASPSGGAGKRGRLTFAGLAMPLLMICHVGCSERLTIKSNPPGATIKVDGAILGTAPVVYSAPSRGVHAAYRISADKPGYATRESIVTTRLSGGRVTGMIFTLGLLNIFRGVRVFPTGELDVFLEPVGETAAETPEAAASGLEGQLTEAKDLLKRGLIDNAEYERLRRRILKDAMQ